MATVMDLAAIPLVQAANYTPSSRTRVDLIVLHSMESQEKPGTARRVAEWFASDSAPQASAHYCIDQAQIVQCVRDEDVAWHAPGANANGIGLEHAGRAAQTRDEWLDPFGRLMLGLSVSLCAALCLRWAIPPVVRSATDLLAHARGITTHAEVSLAFRRSKHWDPGPAFPLAEYARRVERAVQGIEEAWA